MRITLNTLLLGTSLALMGSTMPWALAADVPATTTAGIETADETIVFEPAQSAGASVSHDDFAPITHSEQLRHYLTGAFGPKALNKTAASAGIMQLRNAPKEWGRNPAGYGSRFGSAFAQHFIRGTLQYGASAALHEDNRYLPSGKKGFWKRTGYAASSTFLARRDNGKRRFSFSKIGSAGGAGFISRAWLPSSIATASAAASSCGLIIAFDAGSNMFREFWPDLKHHFGRR